MITLISFPILWGDETLLENREWEGQVYFAGQGDSRMIIVGDREGFVEVETSIQKTFRQGDIVKIRGRILERPIGNRRVYPREISVLRNEPLPRGQRTEISKIPFNMEQFGEWIEGAIDVKLLLIGDEESVVWGTCPSDPNYTFSVRLHRGLGRPQYKLDWINRRIEFSGSLNFLMRDKDLKSIQFEVQDESTVVVAGGQSKHVGRRGASGPRNKSRIKISNLLESEIDDESGVLGVAVVGQVVAAQPGRIVLQDSTAGMLFEVPKIYGLEPGAIVRIEMIRRKRNGVFTFQLARTLYQAPLPLPCAACPKLVFKGESNFCRTSLVASLDQVIRDAGGTTLKLKAAGREFSGRLPFLSEEEIEVIENADIVRVTGVCEISDNGEVMLNLANSEEVIVLSNKYTYGIKSLLSISGLCAFLLVLIFSKARRRVAEQNLRITKLAEQFRSSYETIEEGIIVIGQQGRVVLASRRVNSYLGKCFLSGDASESVWELIRELLVDTKTIEAIDAGVKDLEWSTSFELVLGDEVKRYLEVKVRPIGDTVASEEIIGRLIVIADRTEKKSLEASLLQSQKLEAVGTLAGGIAHNFNNVLLGVAGHITNAQLSTRVVGTEVEAELSAAQDSVFRAADVVRGLLTFSRQDPLSLKVMNVSDLLERIKPLLHSSFDARYHYEFDVQDLNLRVEIDETQIEQVILNLCVNARDAMEDGGEISVSTYAEGAFVVIQVDDTGMGISEEMLEKIFDPFFTTKEPGKGTGLGLAMSHSILEQHGGTLKCESKVGVGSSFKILLPLSEKNETIFQSHSSGASGVFDRESMKGKRILVIDDEATVRKIASMFLKKSGFEVELANSGTQAIEKYRDQFDRFDGVILDLTMPGMTGQETLVAIKQIRPDLPVIISSGYLLDGALCIETPGGLVEADGFIPKPYQLDEFLAIVNELIKRSLIALAN